MIVTIGRQFGSGGSLVGRELAKVLDVPYYDKNLIDNVAEKLGFSPQYVQQVEEKPTGSFLFSMAMYSYATNVGDGMVPAELRVSSAQTEYIIDAAKNGEGVFVGRCADYILKDRDDVVNVFIYADMKSRIERIMERYKLEEREAMRTIQQTDKRRALYYNTNTQRRWGEKETYDLMIDSSKLGIEGTVAVLKQYLELREAAK